MDGLLGFYLLVLVVCGFSDLAQRRVPDSWAAVLWGAAMLYAYLNNPLVAVICGVSFSCLVGINAEYFGKYKKSLLGWGDVLILPTWAAMALFANQGAFVALALAFFARIFFKWEMEERLPFVSYLALAFGLGLFIPI